MAVNLTNADKALKTLYLDVVASQLNENVSPLLAKIKQNSNDVYGKDVKQLVCCGYSGGVGAGTEDGELPIAGGNKYETFTTTLKNLYGTIEISDKAIRASENSSGAFLNLLNAEMEGLIKSSTINFGRMLYGNGSGIIAELFAPIDTRPAAVVSNINNFVPGMVVDFRNKDTFEIVSSGRARVITSITGNNVINFEGEKLIVDEVITGAYVTMSNSIGNDITGLGAIFDTSAQTLYGVERAQNPLLTPVIKEVDNSNPLSEELIQKVLDEIEVASGSSVNMIICSHGVRRALIKLFNTNKTAISTMEIEGGFKAISYNGIPIVADRFCPSGCMYLLNTNDFTLHQLCDWEWLADDDGRVLKQVPGKPVYTATLVKYADLICSRPNGQGLIKGITE